MYKGDFYDIIMQNFGHFYGHFFYFDGHFYTSCDQRCDNYGSKGAEIRTEVAVTRDSVMDGEQ